ncbi:MAG: stage II sporulation protein R [Ruminococcus sp.]|nr:stage II sporulation protein R [Ruminococcus sp.]
MKVLLKSLCVGFIVSILLSLVSFEGECREISEQVFRIHILANSDSEEDQDLKIKVRDAILKESDKLFCGAHNKETVKNITAENLDYFKGVAENTIKNEGYDYSVKASLTNMYFDTRYYDDITMPSGFYDALRIEIGEAKGKNWWCVMYPSLCLSAFSKGDSLQEKLSTKQYGIVSSKGKYKFKFKAVEIFNTILDRLF